MERINIGSNCSFCGKNERAVRRLIAGPHTIFICNECVDLCNDILAEDGITRRQQSGREQPRLRGGL